ncbi:MAG: hypothetical protein ACRDJC_16155 [Thermomicrobiales bacterium]
MLAARRIETAVRLVVAALASTASCVTTQRLTVPTNHFVPNERYDIAFRDPPVSLRAPVGGPSGLFLDVRHRFAIVDVAAERQRPLWRATTRMYEYRLLDHHQRELLVYHWQPGDAYLGPDHPHLHVSAALTAQTSAVDRRSIDLDKLHLATGHVSLPAVVRMLIEEFRVAPQRPDWAATLDRTAEILREEARQSA